MAYYDFVLYEGEVVCSDCLEEEGVDLNKHSYMPVYDDGVWRFYPICVRCGYTVQCDEIKIREERYED